jgi:uncharacterized protein (TIGR04141 family)
MSASAIAAPSVSTVALSLRLLKVKTAQKALKSDHSLEAVESSVGELWTSQAPPAPPSWAGFLGQIAPGIVGTLRTQSCSAVLFIKTEKPSKRLFAVCFGQGHHALDENAIERGFGLKVTLSQVARDHLRTIDSAALDSTVMQRRTQASRNADLIAFEIDTDRELVRLASGSPTTSDFARALTGRDALATRAQVAPGNIVAFCERALTIYEAKAYRRDYPFVDHVETVSNPKLCSELDALAFAELSTLVAGGASDLHLAIPDILAPEEVIDVGYFGTGFAKGRKPTFSELAIEDYVSELKRGDFSSVRNMGDLKTSHEICVMKDGQADRSHRRKVYSCFVHETKHKGETYVLFDGQWYLVDRGFHAEIEKSYQSLLAKPFVTRTTARNERDFIDELLVRPDILCLDQTRASPAGAARANLEPCDFLSTGRHLIHLKDGHASAPLSHLWNQALVSAQSFVSDAKFRADFRKSVRARERKYSRSGFEALVPDGRTKPVPSDFTIVFGVMRHAGAKTRVLDLPFFSKIALRAVAQRLALMGFTVELQLIAKV